MGSFAVPHRAPTRANERPGCGKHAPGVRPSALKKRGRWEAREHGTVFRGLGQALAARPASLPTIRRSIREWLTTVRWPPSEVVDVVLAVHEAATNAVEHAYAAGQAGIVVVTAEVVRDTSERQVLISVTDQGRWQPPALDPGNRGRGIMMMRASMHSLDIARSPVGTRVTMASRSIPALPEDAPGGTPVVSTDPATGFVAELAQLRGYPAITLRGTLTLRSSATARGVLRKALADRGGLLVGVPDLRLDWPPGAALFPSVLSAAGGWPRARVVLVAPTSRCGRRWQRRRCRRRCGSRTPGMKRPS